CAQCPLAARCVANAQGRPHDYPVKTKKLVRGLRSNVMLWLEHRGRTWLVRRPEQGVWAGLACLPLLDDEAALAALTQGWPGARTELPAFKHALTHFDWMLQPVHWQWPARAKAPAAAALAALGEGRWFEPDEALEQGLPAPIRRVLATAPGRPLPRGRRRVKAMVK
ncbi:MAG: NUDIX domain-containing protein, partial [Rubrivivax sp.]